MKAVLHDVLLTMDEEETDRVIGWLTEMGDFRAGFDGCHSNNRKAKHGYGSFMSSVLGLCVMSICIDKDKDAFCAGISQRIENAALR